MKILQVVHGFPPKQRAGTEIYTYYLSKELAKRHEVHVFYPTLENVKEPILVSFNREDFILHELKFPNNNKIRRFLSRLFFENTYINKEIENLFRTLVTNIRPDVIHFEHLIGLSATLIEVAKAFNIPSVLTLHDYWFMCPNIHLLKYDYTICEGPEPNECSECWIKKQSKAISRTLDRYSIPKSLTKKPLQFILRAFYPPEKFKERENYMKSLLLKVDRIIAPSKFLRNLFVEYGVPEDKMIYSENGYDLSIFKGFKKKKKDTDKIIFGFAGGVSRHKGIHVLVDAFMNVPEEKADLRIYGNYNPKSEYVRKILTKAKRKKNIKFMGGFEDVREPYSEIDVLVVPSICHEAGGPLVVREALATKTPVIASRIGSIPELIIDNINGLLVVPNNPKDLYEKIMLIIEHPELINKLKSGMQSVKSINQQAREIVKIYEEILYCRSRQFG